MENDCNQKSLDEVRKALDILKNCNINAPHIRQSCWLAAFTHIQARTFINAGKSLDQAKEILFTMLERHYRNEA